MTRPVVMKFGGAALQDARGVAHVASIVAAAAGPRVVVASAMAGVTDALETSLHTITGDESHVFVLIDTLRERHGDVLRHVAPDDEAAAYALDAGLERLERLLYGVAYTQETTPRLRDLVLSFGERLMAPIVAAALRTAGVPATALDAEHAGVRTRGPYGTARPDVEAMREHVVKNVGAMLPEAVPVVTGFYGVDPDGNATLLGRGGSDHVATLLGQALDATRVELWKDVAGFLTADPEAVPGARLVAQMDYDEAAELAGFGAKVLHPRAVEPAAQAGIPIHIRSFQDPDRPGTVIHRDAPPNGSIRSIASQDGVAVLRVAGPGLGDTPGIAAHLFARLAQAGINVRVMAASHASLALVVEDAEAVAAQQALQAMGGMVRAVDILPDRSLVCVVGRGLSSAGQSARVLAAVGTAVEFVGLGASGLALDFVVPRAHRIDAIKGIHEMEDA